MSRALRIALFLLWTAFVVWQSLTPHPLPPPKWMRWDKLQHAAAYAVLTLFAGLAFAGGRLRAWTCVAVAAVAFGGLLEWGQSFLARGRRPELGDLLANAAGAVAVLLAVFFVTLLKRRIPPTAPPPVLPR